VMSFEIIKNIPYLQQYMDKAEAVDEEIKKED
jgi:hypothetical protein